MKTVFREEMRRRRSDSQPDHTRRRDRAAETRPQHLFHVRFLHGGESSPFCDPEIREAVKTTCAELSVGGSRSEHNSTAFGEGDSMRGDIDFPATTIPVAVLAQENLTTLNGITDKLKRLLTYALADIAGSYHTEPCGEVRTDGTAMPKALVEHLVDPVEKT